MLDRQRHATCRTICKCSSATTLLCVSGKTYSTGSAERTSSVVRPSVTWHHVMANVGSSSWNAWGLRQAEGLEPLANTVECSNVSLTSMRLL